jgi:hypothetical protein
MSDNARTPNDAAEHARQLAEQRRLLQEEIRKDVAVFQRIVKGEQESSPKPKSGQ